MRALTGLLALAAAGPVENVPLLSDLVTDSGVIGLTGQQQSQVAEMLGSLPGLGQKAAGTDEPRHEELETLLDPASEPVLVMCRCGGRFYAAPRLFGKRVPCPMCGGPLDIPETATESGDSLELDDLIEIEQGASPAGTSPFMPSKSLRLRADAEQIAASPESIGEWFSALVSAGDRFLVQTVGEENSILLALLRPFAALGCLAMPVLLVLGVWQAGLYIFTRAPAIYDVQVTPGDAVLSTSGGDVRIEGEGSRRRLVVEAPDGKTRIVLSAELEGYDRGRLALQPEAGQREELVIELIRRPALYQVRLTPRMADLRVEGRGVTVSGEGSQRTVTVAEPGTGTSIVLMAVLDGYESHRVPLQPVPGETVDLVIELVRSIPPAVYQVRLSPPMAELRVAGPGVTVSGEGSQRTVTVVKPGEETEIVLMVMLDGHESHRVELQPVAGETVDLVIELVPRPAVYQVRLTPPMAELHVEGPGVTVSGEGSQRTVTVAKPEEETSILLMARLDGHATVRHELNPVADETQDVTIELLRTMTNPLGMLLVEIPAGEFLMGSPDSDRVTDRDEKPQHRVRITRPFYLGVYPVTQSQWERVMGSNPSRFKGHDHPVETVSWNDCREFIRRLNRLFAKRGILYRLPTEAEWEYACRAGSATVYSFGDSAASLGDYAWYVDNSGRKTHPVGQKKPNAWGLYDMHGNVWEWCSDWSGSYASTTVSDPTGPATGSSRVNRGGGWYGSARDCRSACRFRYTPDYRSSFLGFRLAFSSVDQSGQ